MTFGWIYVGGALVKCKNCLTRDDTGKRSPTASFSRVKNTVLYSLPTVDSAGPSNNSNSILKDLTIRPHLIHGEGGDNAACKR